MPRRWLLILKMKKESMNRRLTREQAVYVAIPKKEWMNTIITRFDEVGCPLIPLQETEKPTPLVYEFPYLALPVILIAYRASDVGKVVNDPRSREIGGFTGTDIAIENKLKTIAALPVDDMDRSARVSMGVTMNWQEKVAKPSVQNLPKDSLVATAYPNMTQSFLKENGVKAQVLPLGGSIEAAAWSYPNCNAVVDVVVSGDTFLANGVRELETVLSPITIEALAEPKGTSKEALQVYERLLSIFFTEK